MQTLPRKELWRSTYRLRLTARSASYRRRNKEQCVPGGGSATVKIVLPAKWDALMAEKDYEPLGKFTLKSDMRPDVPKPKVRGYDRPGVRADVGPGMRRPQGGRGPGMRRRPSSDE